MKKSILVLTTAFFLFAGTAAVLTSCGSDENTEQHEHSDGDMMNNDSDGHMNMKDMDMSDEHSDANDNHSDTDTVYACPMHHDVTGKKGDKCPKCGMELTNTETDPAHKGHTHSHN